jgi:hypothetical protein
MNMKKGIGVGIVTALMPWFFLDSGGAEYRVIDVEQGGTIRGVAKWKGDVPEIPPIIVNQQKDACGRVVPSPVLQIDPKSKGVRFVLVYLESIEKGKKPRSRYSLHVGRHEARPRSMICEFEEHVFAFERRSELSFQNSEKIVHTVHAFDERDKSLFNVVLNNPGQVVTVRPPEVTGVGVRYQCDAHVHMQGWMAAFEHPYFATTDPQGRFELTEVPPGAYTVVAWHEGYTLVGFNALRRPQYDGVHVVKKTIDVMAGETVEIEFLFPAR